MFTGAGDGLGCAAAGGTVERLKTLVILVLLGVIAGGAVWAATSTETEVRIVARRLDDGRTEFGIQQRVDGAWGEEQLPTSRYFPAEVRHDRWLRSSPLRLTVAVSEVDTQSMTEDPPAAPVAPESADGGEAGDSSGDDSDEGDSAGAVAPSYEPVEVEYNEWATGTSQGIYRWQGSELRYAAGDGSAYIWSSLTNTNSGGGVDFRLSCLVWEDGTVERQLGLIDGRGGIHRIFSSDPSTWRWSDRYTDSGDEAMRFRGPFGDPTLVRGPDGQTATWAVAIPTAETWQRMTTADSIRIFYREGRNYSSFGLSFGNVWDSYVGDNLRNCAVSVFPDWAREQIAEDRDLRRSDDGSRTVVWRRMLAPEPADGVSLTVSCLVREGGTGRPELTLRGQAGVSGRASDLPPSQWRWSPFEGAEFKDAKRLDPPFELVGNSAGEWVAVQAPSREMWKQLTERKFIRILYGDRVFDAGLPDLWASRVGDNLVDCYDLRFPRLDAPAGADTEHGAGGSVAVY